MSFKWRHCATSQQVLQEPITACGLGRLYTKSIVIESLLDKANIPESINHIKSMKVCRAFTLLTRVCMVMLNMFVGHQRFEVNKESSLPTQSWKDRGSYRRTRFTVHLSYHRIGNVRTVQICLLLVMRMCDVWKSLQRS